MNEIKWLTLAQNNLPVVISNVSTLMGGFLLAKHTAKKDFDAHKIPKSET